VFSLIGIPIPFVDTTLNESATGNEIHTLIPTINLTLVMLPPNLDKRVSGHTTHNYHLPYSTLGEARQRHEYIHIPTLWARTYMI